MTRPFLAAVLGLLPIVAPAAQTMRPDARPVGGTLQPRPDGPAATLALTLRAVSETGMPDCPGFVDPSAPDAVVEWPGGPLRLTTTGDFDAVLAVSGPDGTWSCNDDGDGMAPLVDLMTAPRGRYAVWVGSYGSEAGQQAVTLTAGTRPPVPTFNLSAFPPEGATRVVAGFEAESGPQNLAVQSGGSDSVMETGIVTEMPDTEYCAGYVNASVPSAVIDYEGQGTLAFAAMGVGEGDVDVDMTLAVHTPGGAWRCSDDFDGVNPAIGIESAAGGRYAVWVGTYGVDAGSPSTVLMISETMPVAPEMDYVDDMDMGSMPYAEGTYMTYVALQPDARPAIRLTVGQEAVSGTASVLPEGSNPVAGATCSGFVAAAPTASVEMAGAGPFGITATAEDGSDLVLAIQTPDNRWFCSDDANNLDPGVQFGSADETEVAAGTYRVWVGTFGDPNPMAGMEGMDGMEGMEPPGPTTVTVTAARGEITVTTPDYGMDGGMDFPDFTAGTYDGQDLQPGSPGQTLTLRDNAAEATVMAGGTLINPVDGDACAGFVDARPAFALTATDTPLSITASAEAEDLVMLVHTPSGGWLCSDDAEGSNPRVETSEAGTHGVWVGTFSRPTAPVSAVVSVSPAPMMGE
jgi:hypothetical protein